MYYIINLTQDGSKQNKYLSNTLLQKIDENIKKGKKTIIYINRRGEFNCLFCKDCQHLYKCLNCDISISVHNNPKKLVCHICGFTKDIDLRCEKCSSTNLDFAGVGTEQIENSLKKIFPNISIFRLDTDSIKNKTDKNNALNKLYNSQIIIGTKMITTGFDFQDVDLIAVILLEQELVIPKYNIEEITYNNIKQLIGRGRNIDDKEIIIQTFLNNNETIKSICEDNYKDFFKKTIEERKLFGYPPFNDFAILEYRDPSEEKSLNFCKILKNKLDIINSKNDFEIILNSKGFRKNNQFHHKIILKGANLRDFLENIRYEIIRNPKLSLSFE
nr:primosomal protein N' [Candidatus Gracilibacteria bacterium]